MDFHSPTIPIKFKDYPIVWVKRDDLIDPYISGNKWRKLKYVLEDAIKQGKTHLVTFGGAYSNHLLACAAAAARFGLKVTAFVRGEEVENDTIFLSRLFGMQHIFVNRADYRDKVALYKQYFEFNSSAYFIDEGGAGELAVKGCVEILKEVELSFDHIFCAAGTGTTAAGILRYMNDNKYDGKLHVVPVLKDQGATLKAISNYESNCSSLLIESDYHFGGYAKTNAELLNFIQEFTSQTGLLIDHVYTGKMFYAIYDSFNTGKTNLTSKVLAIHTGGLIGLLGAKSSFV